MALTGPQKTAIRSLITQEGGLDVLFGEVLALFAGDKTTAALTALQSAVTITVSDWTAPAGVVAVANSQMLNGIVDDVTTAIAAHDASKLGPQLIVLYAAVKAHLGR